VLIVVTGTGTDVGKTFVTAATIRLLRDDGIAVAARKPVQSFDPDEHDRPTDAHVLAGASGEDVARVCPAHRWLRTALAPPMAAEVLGHPAFSIRDLAAETCVEPGVVTFVESAGGVRSPLASDGDTLTLCAVLQPDGVVLVADAGLGTINAVRLTMAALEPYAATVVLNRYDAADDLHRRNREWLDARDGFDVVTSPEELARRVRSISR
jgi:dethiobiotin synthetase